MESRDTQEQVTPAHMLLHFFFIYIGLLLTLFLLPCLYKLGGEPIWKIGSLSVLRIWKMVRLVHQSPVDFPASLRRSVLNVASVGLQPFSMLAECMQMWRLRSVGNAVEHVGILEGITPEPVPVDMNNILSNSLSILSDSFSIFYFLFSIFLLLVLLFPFVELLI